MSVKNERYINILLEAFQFPSFLHQKIENDICLISYNSAAKKMTHNNISEIFKQKPEIIMDLQRCINEQTNFCKELAYQIGSIGEMKYYNFRYSFIHPDLILMSTEDITEKKVYEQKLINSKRDLKERVRHLRCLYHVSTLMEQPNISIIEIIKGTLTKIPSAWKFSELIGVKIVYDRDEYKTENFKDTPWKIISNISINGKLLSIKVISLEESPFFSEQIDFLNEIGSRLKAAIERKEFERILKREKKKAQLYLDLAGVIIVALNREGEINMINKKGYEVLEYEEGELINKNWFEIFIPKPRINEIQAIFKKLINGELDPSEFYENPIITKNGKEKIIAWHNTLLYDDEGKTIGTLSSGEDITDRRKAEDSLKLSQEKLKKLNLELEQKIEKPTKELKTSEEKIKRERDNLINILDSMEDLIYIVNQNYEIEYANPSMIRAFGVLKDQKCFEYTNERSEPCPTCKIPEVLKEKTIRSEWYSNKNQGVYDVVDTPLRRSDGSIAKLRIFRDITYQKMAEKKLRESEEKLKTLFEQAPDSIYVVDPESQGLIEFNTKSYENLGYTKEEFKKLKVSDIEFYDSPELIIDRMKKIFDSEGAQIFETKHITKNGELRDMYISAQKILIQGKKYCQVICKDITEVKKAEQKLKDSEEKFRTFTESSPAAILIYQNYQCVYINPAAKDITGYSFDDLSTMKFWDFLHPDYKDFAIEGGKAIQRGENPPTNAELKIFTKFGIEKWIDARLEIIKYQERRAILITAIDITERKQAEEKAIFEQKQLLSIFDGIDEAIYIADPDTYELLYLNNAVKSRWKARIGDKCYKVLQNKDSPCSFCSNKYIFGENLGETYIWEWQNLIDRRWYRCIDRAIKWPDGRMVRYEMAINVSKLKKAEQKLRESEKKYRHLFDQSPNMIVLSNPNRMIIDVNSSFLNYFGYKKEELLGKSLSIIKKLPPENKGLYKKIIEEAFTKGFLEPIEFRAYDKNNNEKWMELRASLIELDNNKMVQIILQDINTRKRAKEELKSERDKLKAIIDGLTSAGLGIDIIGDDYKVLYINEVMKEKFGDNLGKLCYKNIMASGEPCESCPVMKSITTKAIEHVEQSAIDNRNYEIFSAPIPNPDGTIDKAVELIIDITERKKAEQNLMESEEKFRTFTEKSLLGIAVLQDNIIKYANDRMAEMSGYSVEEILAWKPGEFMKVISPEQYDFVLEQAKKKQLGLLDVTNKYQIKCIKKSGEIIYIDTFSKTINYDGKPADLITQIDITEQIEVEQKLQESEEKYRYLFEYSPSAILLFDLNGKILEINPMVKKIFGYSKEDLEGKNFAKLNIIHQDYSDLAVKLFKEVVNKGGSALEEFLYYRKDRSLLWGLTQSSLLKLGDKFYMQSIIQDITELKEAERLILEENKKLLELEKMRDEIITRVSHELKTPLTPLINGSELLTTVYRDQMGKEAREIIEMIYESGLRFKSLIENVLDISVIDYDYFELIRKKENLIELINRAVEELSFFANNRGITINLTLSETIYFNVDKSRMEQAIKNILSNAIKNTPKKGEIFIRAVEHKEYIDIVIEDTGVGLTNKEKQRLFEKFGKIERYGKGLDVDIDGSGLGLYITKHLIILHNGEILVESEGRNKGATFTIRLFRN